VPFYRFEQLEDIVSNPHLSTGKGPIIEGDYMNLRLNNKEAGTGSKLHYHPNELMVFPLLGKIDSIVGSDHRVVSPGTFVHVAPNVLHSMKATLDGTVSYLYVKDRTWSMVGVAAGEAPPEQALSIDELKQALARGEQPGGAAASGKSEGLPEAPGDSYFPIIERLDAASASARRSFWVEGTRLSFGFIECPAGSDDGVASAAHEQFIYVIGGAIEAAIEAERKSVGPGDILHVPKGAELSFMVGDAPARYVVFQPTPALEQVLDGAA